jgi:hypothetical protein
MSHVVQALCHSAYSAALRRVDAATCSHPGACTVCVDVAGRSCESMAYTVPPQNTPPGGRPGDFVAADVNAEARRPKRACGLRGCLKSEVRGPMTANWGDSQLGAAVKTRRRALRKAALKATVRATWRTTVGAASRAMVTAPQPATVRGTGTATDRTPGRATQAIAC